MTRTQALLQDLQRTRDQTLGYFRLPEADLARTYAPGKWSVRFLLHHLADSETVFFDRIRRVICEPRQVIWVYDQDAWAEGLDYATVPLELASRVFEPVRAATLYYAERHYQRSGDREFVHSVTGVHTLRDEFERIVSHTQHHLEQIQAALTPP
jgi:hypothetical protein